MKISMKAYEYLVDGCLPVPPETGGLVGGDNGCITEVYYIYNVSDKSSFQYAPNIKLMNSVIADWMKNNIDFLGIFHTHPSNCCSLSCEDKIYIDKIMLELKDKKKELYFPIVIPGEKIIFYKAIYAKDRIVYSVENIKKFRRTLKNGEI